MSNPLGKSRRQRKPEMRQSARAKLRRSWRLELERLEPRHLLADASPPAFLQWFDGSYKSMESRAIDAFNAGYGSFWLPPPGRADTSNQSVGYDVYDRHDLGQPGNPTLYGTETGLRATIDQLHRIGGAVYIDLIWNHNGYSDLGLSGFTAAGGYPGLAITLPTDIDGDFHSSFDSGDLNGRLAGLVDIAQEKNHVYVRNPVPGFANNLPAGTTPLFGRLANVPAESNRRFYPDRDLNPIMLFDPTTGETNIPVYPFNLANPQAGDPIAENALGYLMRTAQWMVQSLGVDGYRVDAAKHFPTWVMNYLDRAVYRSSLRPNLDGSRKDVFSFSEVFDGDKGYLQSFIRKDINPNDPGRIGGNRDVLDFPLYFAMRGNLTGNGFTNDWRNIVNASQDLNDDGFNNGSQGVMFVQSHDEFGPYLGNVAYAYMLMRPGNAIVYFNGQEFGNRSFPKDGRGDALGGLYGDALAKLVNLRNTHAQGNFINRTPGGDAKEMLLFERQGSSLVVLSNRMDGGFDSRTIQTSFPAGTPLVELTGNAADASVDPFNDFPEVVVVNGDGTVNLRVPRNRSPNGTEHGRGYFVYGLAQPQGTMTLTNVASTLPGGTPSNATNGTTRLAPIDVITGNSFQVRLDTVPVNLLGVIRDAPADGDNALLRIDEGTDLNGNGHVDFVSPGNAAYGFEQFVDKSSPLWTGGDGQFRQTVNAVSLSEGTHFVTVRAFRHREPNSGEPLYVDFRRAIYVDRLPADTRFDSFNPIVNGQNENRRLVMRSADKTADNMHVLFDLGAAKTDAEVLAMVGAGSQTNQLDRDLFAKDATGLTHGNHVATVVTYEISGRARVQRFPGLFTSTIFGAGLGDVNSDGQYNSDDVSQFRTVLLSRNQQFNAAADFNGDGFVNYDDLLAFGVKLSQVGANAATLAAYGDLRVEVFAAIGDGYSVSEDDVLNIVAAGVLANDHDPRPYGGGFSLLTTGNLSSARGGAVVLRANGSFDYTTPTALQSLRENQSVDDTFTYDLSDGFGNTSRGTVTITVTGLNDAPVITLSKTSVLEKQLGAIVGQLTISDPDTGDSSVVSIADPRFEFTGTNLRLKANQSLTAATEPFVDVQIQAADHAGTGTTTSRTFRIDVTTNTYPWHADLRPLDVDRDRFVTPRDALIIINWINELSRDVPLPRPPLPDPPREGNFPDVVPDNQIVPRDALLVINEINQPSGEGEFADLNETSDHVEAAPLLPGPPTEQARSAHEVAHDQAFANGQLQTWLAPAPPMALIDSSSPMQRISEWHQRATSIRRSFALDLFWNNSGPTRRRGRRE